MPLAKLLESWQGERSEVVAAASLGVAPSTLSNWKDGLSLPPSTRIPALATALGLPVEDLRALIATERDARAAAKAQIQEPVHA